MDLSTGAVFWKSNLEIFGNSFSFAFKTFDSIFEGSALKPMELTCLLFNSMGFGRNIGATNHYTQCFGRFAQCYAYSVWIASESSNVSRIVCESQLRFSSDNKTCFFTNFSHRTSIPWSLRQQFSDLSKHHV